MSVIKYSEAQIATPAEGIHRRIAKTENLMVAIIDFTNGPKSEPDPMHSHPHEQVSYLAQGEVLFFIEDEAPQHLTEGDMFFVASGKQHCIQLLSKTARLIDSFSPIREDFL